MRAGGFLRQLARESRGARGRLAFFALCLALGVAGVTAVDGISRALRDGVRHEARRLLGGDLRIRSLRPLPEEARRVLDAHPELRRTLLREMPTVVAVPQAAATAGRPRTQLVELRAVDGAFPFYGRLALEPDRPLGELLADDGAVAGPELFTRLGVRVGDAIAVGGKAFTLRGVVRSEPDRLGGGFSLGPRLFVAGSALDATGLLAFGSRVEQTTLVAFPAGTAAGVVDKLARELRSALPDSAFHRIETFAQGQPELRRGIDRTERFLGLAALLSLLVGGVGVAQAVRAWLAARLEAIAVWKTLGARPREIAALYVAQVALLAAGGSVAGVLAGLGLARLAPRLAASFLPELPAPSFEPLAAVRGLALGIGVALLFAAAPLASALRVPALRVLRRDAEPLPLSRRWLATIAIVLLAGTAAISAAQSGSLAMGGAFAGGLAVTAALLAGAARLLIRLTARVPRLRLPIALRWGLAALSRPGTGTTANVVALGVGALTLVGMANVERSLVARFGAELPKDAPTSFLIDIQPSQWEGVRELIAQAGATRIDSVPLVMARLSSLDGRKVSDLAASDERERRRRWALTREQRLTWLAQLPPDNEIVAGKLWSDPAHAEVSVEEDYARELGLTLGSRVTFDIQGTSVELVVTSLRKVRWESFGINFFWVVEPGALDSAPQLRIAAARLPPGGDARLRDALADRYANVTLFEVREVLDKIVSVLEKIGRGIRYLGLFTVTAAAAILAGAVAATAARRGRDVALGKSLGMTRAQVVSLFASEYALVGLVGGVVGSLAGTALAAVVLREGFEIPWHFEPGLIVATSAGTALLATLAGLLASARALAERPIQALRRES